MTPELAVTTKDAFIAAYETARSEGLRVGLIFGAAGGFIAAQLLRLLIYADDRMRNKAPQPTQQTRTN
jgi:hypothetical protein